MQDEYGMPWVMTLRATGWDHAQENHQPTAESVKGAAASGGGLLHKSGGAQRVPLQAANAGNVNSPYEGVRAESSAMDTDARGESHSGAREPEEQVKGAPCPNTQSNTHRAGCEHLRPCPLDVFHSLGFRRRWSRRLERLVPGKWFG